MSDHAAVNELLGAWALDACSAEEVATVESHLAGCPECAADADRLGRVAAGLGSTVATAPPPRLRGTVLAAALARRPAVARPVADEDVGAGYAGWVDRFDGLLERLTPEQWRERVVRDWTVQDLVAHLIASDELLVAQLTSARAAMPEDPAELDGTLLARRTAAAIDEQRGRPPERTRAAWRAQADRLVHDVAARPAVLDQPVRLADPRLPRQPLRIALVQRLFETWIHTDDVRASMGAPPAPPDPDQVAMIVRFGVRVLPAALRLLGGDPDRSARLVLSGPAGGEWTLPSSPAGPARPPDATVTMDAVEFCYLLGNRRDPASVARIVQGDPVVAASLLRAIATVGCDRQHA
jgi:uncharacterized protein (TIGR03083 family)